MKFVSPVGGNYSGATGAPTGRRVGFMYFPNQNGVNATGPSMTEAGMRPGPGYDNTGLGGPAHTGGGDRTRLQACTPLTVLNTQQECVCLSLKRRLRTRSRQIFRLLLQCTSPQTKDMLLYVHPCGYSRNFHSYVNIASRGSSHAGPGTIPGSICAGK
jgi:hypothetical protein